MVEDDEDRSAQMTIHAELSLAEPAEVHIPIISSINQKQAKPRLHRLI